MKKEVQEAIIRSAEEPYIVNYYVPGYPIGYAWRIFAELATYAKFHNPAELTDHLIKDKKMSPMEVFKLLEAYEVFCADYIKQAKDQALSQVTSK